MDTGQDTTVTTADSQGDLCSNMYAIDRPTTAHSQRSTPASLSTFGIQSAIEQATTTNWRRRLISDAKLFSLIIPPLIIVISLCALSLKTAGTAIQIQNTLQGNLEDSENFGYLATALQKERGRTCVYASVVVNRTSNSTVVEDAFSNMQRTRRQTDTALQRIVHWMADENDGPEFANNSSFYTSINKKLVTLISRPFRQTADGSFWSLMEAYHLLLLAKDYFGLKRALGAAYFAHGTFSSTKGFAEFSSVVGAANELLSTALYLSPEAKWSYEQMIQSTGTLVTELDEMRKEILGSNVNSSRIRDTTRGLVWFDNMTTYLNVISQVDSYLSNLILARLNYATRARNLEYYLIVACVVAVLCLCPPVTVWYVVKSRKLVNRIETFIRKLSAQTKAMTVEKQRTELLLYQLLPKAIAMELKQNKTVSPEHYEEATVFFSDVQGFTTLSCKSTPLQVIEFLNQLYTKCDHILDQYDVYKVETIGDAYMVVSGVPKRNGKNHSAETASMALHILMAMEEFRIPHMPDERLLMRIGVHTGPVAAGIVGNKMPRYCLFGGTVTTASAMESTGLALRVHLSPWANSHLHTWHPDVFQTVERGEVHIRSAGSISTYWLLAKRYFPFKVDLQAVDNIISKTTYWRR